MRSTGCGLIALLILSNPAFAETDYELAASLGDMLSSEKVCGLAYRREAIEAFIEQRVPADDIEFPRALTTMTASTELYREGMTESERTAHCAQVRRVAKSFGFID